MPRPSTGNPRGRPKGTGRLTPAQTVEEAQTRVTVRLPTVLYDRLEAFAAGRSYHRGSPQLARCVREALEEYLDRHTNRQTEIISLYPVNINRQTENATQGNDVVAQTAEGENWQTRNVSVALESLDPEPAEKDSVEWRRWAVLDQVRTAQEPSTPGAIAKQLGYKSGDIRNDLEHWRKQGRVRRDERGYVYGDAS